MLAIEIQNFKLKIPGSFQFQDKEIDIVKDIRSNG